MTAENEAPRWIDEELRTAIRTLGGEFLARAREGVPAERQAWTEAAQMVAVLMEQHGIAFSEPFDPGPMTAEILDGLLNEAELSRGPVTPAVRAMVGIFEWLLAQERAGDSTSYQLDGFARRAVAIWGGRGSLTTSAIQRASPEIEEIDHSEPVEAQAPPMPAPAPVAPTPPAAAEA